ncbi:hypothetical protein [Actinoplanes sp. GCM10030250]|uniref:hypothetical protein n=1 Tax=Actinoplanes sp. GCM10030250 TaxID=3273376 RepID=UPI00360AB8FE
MAERHETAEPKKIHGDKLAEAFTSERQPADEADSAPGDVRLLSRHPAASSQHVVRR